MVIESVHYTYIYITIYIYVCVFLKIGVPRIMCFILKHEHCWMMFESPFFRETLTLRLVVETAVG